MISLELRNPARKVLETRIILMAEQGYRTDAFAAYQHIHVKKYIEIGNVLSILIPQYRPVDLVRYLTLHIVRHFFNFSPYVCWF
jgi:hypothetical protein